VAEHLAKLPNQEVVGLHADDQLQKGDEDGRCQVKRLHRDQTAVPVKELLVGIGDSKDVEHHRHGRRVTAQAVERPGRPDARIVSRPRVGQAGLQQGDGLRQPQVGGGRAGAGVVAGGGDGLEDEPRRLRPLCSFQGQQCPDVQPIAGGQ